MNCLRTILNHYITDAAKRSLVSNFDSHQPTFGEKSASAWMTASGRLGVALTATQVTVLGQAGAPAKQVFDFLIAERARFTSSELLAILPYCGQPYASLASANGATLTAPYSEELRDVLQTLKAANIVKDFRKKTLREQFDVHMAG